MVAAELDSFEGRKDPERCTALVNQLRSCQARVLNVVSQMMDETVKDLRAPRDFRVKFPDDVIQENLAGQLWFGAECLAAGSSIMNREVESACMRPLARALTKNLDSLRSILREQCLRSVHEYTESIRESLIIFDKLFAEFELSYVTAMVPVKTAHEYDMIQEITVLFSETVQRALRIGLLTRDMIDEYDPALMFTIPRLAIVSGVLIFKDGPLNPDNDPWNISEMFRPFQTLLLKIRELLSILTDEELNTLERALCSQEEPSFLISLEEKKKQDAREERRKSREERKQKGGAAKAKKKKDESDDGSIESELTAMEIAERLEALALNFEASRNAKSAETSEQPDLETQSKSSESSSTSSSSLLSEADVEEGSVGDAAKGSGSSDHSDDMQVQRFTNQLYYEANLDSHDMREDVSIMGPLNAFTPDQIFSDPPSLNAAGAAASSAESAVPQTSVQENDDECNANTGSSAAGRAHFAMNKCDSSDSGLHSEVLSNSGSMFTISSSDSNQLLGDAPASSECSNQHSPSPSHPSCVQAAAFDDENDDASVAKCDLGACKSIEGVHIDSMDSSNTLVPESESSCDDKQCLNSPSDHGQQEKRKVAGTIIDEDDIMVSPLEEQQKLITSIETSKSVEPHCDIEQTGQVPLSNVTVLNQNVTDSVSSTQIPVCDRSHGSHKTHVVASSEVGSEVRGNPKDTMERQEPSRNCVNQNVENSQGKCSVSESVCDSKVPKQDRNEKNVVGAQCTDSGSASSKTDALKHSHSNTVDTTESFLAQPTLPPPVTGEDRENNNEVKDSTVVSESITVSCPSTKDSLDKTPPTTEQEDQKGSRPQDSPVACSRTCSPTSTTSAQVTTSITTGVQQTSEVSTNEAGKSHESSENAPPSVVTTETRHSSATTTLSSPASPSASTTMSNHMDTKGPSTAKGGSKKSSKSGTSESKRRRRGDPASSLSQRSAMPNQAKALMDSHLLDSECYHSSETSSYTSECGDQEEIALAIKAAESATRHQVRARFRSSSDMIHRLFVCISGVADQLQTNFAGDLRNILRAVFDMNCSEPIDISDGDKVKDTTPLGAAYRAMSHASRNARRARHSSNQRQDPPLWIPDEQSNECMSCQVPFTFVRRRHHCRNCGKIFCSRCSSNFVPLPHFGQERAVRVCNRCFMFRVTPFTVRPAAS